MNWYRNMAVAGAVVFGVTLSAGSQEPKKTGPDPKLWEATVDKAIVFLRKGQEEKTGGWSTLKSRGCTGVVLTGILQTGRVPVADPMIQRGLKYIESLINEKSGHISGKDDPAPQLLNYVTSINIMALDAAGKKDYEKVIKNAAKFLKDLQWDENHGKGPENDFHGGFGYDSKSRPDLSNSQFGIEALIAAGVPKDDPALKRALIFLSRCQNLKGEGNDQPWAGKINDGSFIYSAAGGGVTKVESEDGALLGYGSMTYAGIKSMIYCGVPKGDKRVEAAFAWIQKNYTVDGNPGMPKIRAERGLYYYYHTMAKTLDLMGIDEVVDAKGVKHDWRKEITEALAKRQKPDGSWSNDLDQWMEGDPNLVTGYALMALSHCKPKK